MNAVNLKIGSRLALGFGAVLGILVVMVTLGNSLNAANKEKLLNGLDLANNKSSLTQTMRLSLLDATIGVRNLGLMSDVSLMQNQDKRIKAKRLEYDQTAAQLSELGLDDEEREIINEIKETNKKSDELFNKARGQALAFNPEGASKIIIEEMEPLTQNLLLAIAKLDTLEKNKAKNVLLVSVEGDKTLKEVLSGCAFIAVILGVICGWATSRSIVIPLKILSEGALRVQKESDFTLDLGKTNKDELGQTVQAFRFLFDGMRQSLGGIKEATKQVVISSHSLSSEADIVAISSQAQSDASINMSKQIQEMSVSISQATQQAKETLEIVGKNAALAKAGVSKADQLLENLKAKEGLSATAAEQMIELDAAAKNISDVSETIASIAAQTNLLALNAAIEAARAGESGRGFAVVADEVRKLADSTRKATEGIAETITKMGELSSKVLDNAKTIALESRKDAESAESFKESLSLIGESSEEVLGMVKVISIAMGEQDQASRVVAKQVDQVAESSKNNGASAQSSLKAAKELTKLAGVVEQLVDRYKI